MHNTTYIIILILFLVGIALIDLWSSKRTKNANDWMVAGHKLGLLPCIGTYFATIVSSVSILSYVGYFYLNGLGGAWIISGTFLTSILAYVFYAAKLREYGVTTLPDFLERRFGKLESILGACITLVASVFLLCAQLIAGTMLMKIMTGLNTALCTILFAFLLICLTFLGGMNSVAWTDTFCSGIMLLGVWILMIVMLMNTDDVSGAWNSIKEIDRNLVNPFGIGIPMALSWLFTWGFGNFGVPQFVARFFTAKDSQTAKKSQIWTLLLLAFFYFPLILVGIIGIVALPGLKEQDEVTIHLINVFLNPVTGGIIFSAILASCVSTADSILLLSATTLANDIYRKRINSNASSEKLVLISKVSTLSIGVLAVIVTLIQSDGILWIQARMVTLMGAAMAPSVLVGSAWKGANNTGGLSSFITGLLTAIIWYALNQPFNMMPMLPAFIVGMAAMFIGSAIGNWFSREKREEE